MTLETAPPAKVALLTFFAVACNSAAAGISVPATALLLTDRLADLSRTTPHSGTRQYEVTLGSF